MPAQETLRAKIEAHLDAIRALLGGLVEDPDFAEVERPTTVKLVVDATALTPPALSFWGCIVAGRDAKTPKWKATVLIPAPFVHTDDNIRLLAKNKGLATPPLAWVTGLLVGGEPVGPEPWPVDTSAQALTNEGVPIAGPPKPYPAPTPKPHTVVEVDPKTLRAPGHRDDAARYLSEPMKGEGSAPAARGRRYWWLLLFNEAGRWSLPGPHDVRVPEMVTRQNLVALLGSIGGGSIDDTMSIALSLDPPLKCDPWPMRAQP